jgi:hypothetical protein
MGNEQRREESKRQLIAVNLLRGEAQFPPRRQASRSQYVCINNHDYLLGCFINIILITIVLLWYQFQLVVSKQGRKGEKFVLRVDQCCQCTLTISSHLDINADLFTCWQPPWQLSLFSRWGFLLSSIYLCQSSSSSSFSARGHGSTHERNVIFISRGSDSLLGGWVNWFCD